MTIETPIGRSTKNTEVTRLFIVARRPLNANVVELRLRAAGSASLPHWTPGAHIELMLPDDTVRQYSLCGSLHDPQEWRIAVLRVPDGRGGSRRVHEELQEGGLVDVRGPYNHFPLVPSSNYLFVAGGIGVTPILPMIAEARRVGASWKLHYTGRSRATMAYSDALQSLGESDRITLWPQDETGRMDLRAVLSEAENTQVYCCGPASLIEETEMLCAEQNGRHTLHIERFTSAGTVVPRPSGSFEVECRATGVTVIVPEGKSILNSLRAAGLKLLSSCGEGVCGTCETSVLEGAIDHRDSFLNEDEQAAQNTMMICVSRAADARIVLDL